MESNTKKCSLENFPSLLATFCNSISTDNLNENLLSTCSQIIRDLSEPSNIVTLIDFWKNDVPEDTPVLTKAIMYECLYIIYSSFENSTDAYNFLDSLSETI